MKQEEMKLVVKCWEDASNEVDKIISDIRNSVIKACDIQPFETLLDKHGAIEILKLIEEYVLNSISEHHVYFADVLSYPENVIARYEKEVEI